MTEVVQDILTALRERYPEVLWQSSGDRPDDVTIVWGRGASGRFRVAVCVRGAAQGGAKLYGELRMERGGIAASTMTYEFSRRGAVRAVDGALKAYRESLEASLSALNDYKRGR